MLINLLMAISIANAQDFKQIQTGQPAPFDGTLLRPEAMAVIITKNEAEVEMCKADAEHAQTEQKINCDLDKKKLQYDLELYTKTNELLMSEKEKELQKAYDLLKKQSVNHTPLWIGIGFTAGLVASYGTIYIYNQIEN